jgi:subtilisin-like proprotein convertase family protein
VFAIPGLFFAELKPVTQRFSWGLPLLLALMAAPRATAEEVRPSAAPAVFERLDAGEGEIPVLVTLRPAGGEGDPRPARERIRAAEDEVTRGLPPSGFREERRLENAPVLTGRVTRAGLAELLGRPGVLHVALDGVVHPAGQLGTAQVGADRLLTLGVTGLGRSVAIVDSGVEPSFPDPPSGPRHWAGWNFADGNSDLTDCSGHGSAVAGVVAGPQGMAPEAGIVVLRVFGKSDGCRSAWYSGILAALDWAISNKDTYAIEAINLSLADDRLRTGFCDGEDAASASLFAAARAAGIAVVAAAGNDGKTTGLPWPACMSDVTSVGMVYSASVGPVAWGGAAPCSDGYTGPDVVPCATNSGSGLSLLAPGFGWTTAVLGGGQTSTFSGTSAAAPAATGALLLARQARPLLDPALAADLLRATGAPVLDTRAHRIVPRPDLGGAFDATTPVTGPCSSTSIPDGTSDGIVCDAFVSSIVGRVSSVVVSLAIDHPDPTNLVVSLTGPDGTSVVLMNRSGRPGYAVREVFGRTSIPIEPLSSFAGKDAAGTWRLRILDTVPGAAGRIVSWSLQIEPFPITWEPATLAPTALFPTSARKAGRFGAFFTTDVRVFNTNPSVSRTVNVRFMPSETGDLARSFALTVPPLATRVLNDILGDAFRTTGFGPIFLEAPVDVVAASRTSSTAVRGGSFGLSVPSVHPDSAAGPGGTLVLVPAYRSSGFRVNVGVTEVTGHDATVEILVKDAHGAVKGSMTAAVPAGSLVQMNDIHATVGALLDENDRFEIRVVAGGNVVGFATAIDNRTNDGAFVSAAPPQSDLLIAATARAAGKFGARFQTDLKLSNGSASQVRVKVSFQPTLGPAFDPVLVTLGSRETRLFADVLGQLFVTSDDAAGALHLTVLDGGAVSASSRTYTDAGGGSYGLAIDPATPSGQAGPGQRLALSFLSGSDRSRTNVGFVETAGLLTHARFTVYSPVGQRLASRDFSLAAFGAVQWNDVFALLAIPPLEDASAILEVIDGGILAAHSIQLDNRTNDGNFFPAVLLP